MGRRLILVAALLALVAVGISGIVWWWPSDPLSAEERRLVGAWWSVSDVPEPPHILTFRADRRYESRLPTLPSGEPVSVVTGRWAIRDDHLILDSEPSAIRRALRPLAARVGLTIDAPGSYGMEVRTGKRG